MFWARFEHINKKNHSQSESGYRFNLILYRGRLCSMYGYAYNAKGWATAISEWPLIARDCQLIWKIDIKTSVILTTNEFNDLRNNEGRGRREKQQF